MPHSCFSLSSLGMTEIMASCREIVETCTSLVNPSEPGDFPTFSLEMDESNLKRIGENTAGKRYFKILHQDKYKNTSLAYRRQCGSREANHFHIFWDCPKLSLYWNGIHKTLSTVFKTQIPLNLETLYLGYVLFLKQRLVCCLKKKCLSLYHTIYVYIAIFTIVNKGC